MLNLLRKFLRPTLREQLEDGVREALRRYADRQTAPNLRVFVSTDLIPEGVEHPMWARDEGEHLRRFALQWAEDNEVPRVGIRVEVILLDTKKEFAFVKPVGVEPPAGADVKERSRVAPGPPAPMVGGSGGGTVRLDVVASPSLTAPLRIESELTVGRKAEGSVFGVGDRYMSSRHARFHLAGGKLYVTDLDSKNRTFVNDRPIPPHQQVPASVGDQIRMGTTTLLVAELES
ncbi:MAG: FHA domain-containing protein [Gemmatimonadota bacterium]